MEIFLKCLLGAFETFLLIFFLNSVLIKNDERQKMRRIAFLSYFIFQCFTYIVDFPFFSTSYFYILFSLFISLCFYYDEIRVKLIASSLFVTLNYAGKLLSSILYTTFSHLELPPDPFHYVLNLQTQFLACLIIFFVILTIILTRRSSFKHLKVAVNLMLFFFPLLNLFATMNVLKDINSQILYYDITFLLFGYTFFLFFIIDQIVYSSERHHHSQVMDERLSMQNKYYKDIEQYNLEMKRFRHDMRNHLSMIAGMLKNEQLEDAASYVALISEKIDSIRSVINSGNTIVDIVLNNKAALARDQGIATHHELVIPPILAIDSVDLSVILGNLYDNAIEANEQILNDKWIKVQILIYKGALFIDFKNHYDGFIKTSEHHYLSRKANSSEHGIGLSNVRMVVEKNHGTITVSHDDKIFNISIMLPQKEK